MNTLLTVADIEYLLTQQEKLDKDIREKFNISNEKWKWDMQMEHELALRVEIHEMINEAFAVWKYWKTKPMNMNRLLDEAIDVIHFVMLDINKHSEFPGENAGMTYGYLEHAEPYDDDKIVKIWLNRLSSGEYFTNDEVLAVVLLVLDYYGFTAQDILDAYNRKNKVNFERLESGY